MNILGTQPIYGARDSGASRIVLDVCQIREAGFLNFTGYSYADQKYKIVRNLVSGVFSGFAIVTHNDLVAHDAFIENLDKKTPIIMIVGDKAEIAGASKLRLERAKEKLEAEGYDCVHLVSSVKQAEALIKKVKTGTIERAAKNVIKVNFGRVV